MRVISFLAVVAAVIAVSACAPMPREVSQNDIERLAQQISSLGDGVDPQEAERAARISYTYSLQLAEQYNVTDSAIVHNAKVNNGLRERGLCVHWAEDIEKRLNAERFRTLQVHRAIAEGNEFRIDHSTAIISQRGGSFDEGVVLDPWRYGGLLYWSPTREDPRYFWEAQRTVLERKYRNRLSREQG